MNASHRETGDLAASLEHIAHNPALESDDDRPYPFVYHIRLENRGVLSLRVQGRKWVVTGESGRIMVVEGEGVVGQSPVIEPGENFRYNSYLTIGENSTVAGCFFAQREDGALVAARLPEFHITLPG